MDKHYVIIAGNGTTSRANLEALIEDHFHANGENGVLILPYQDKASQGQIFAAQWAKDKNKDIVVYAPMNKFDAMPSATVVDGDLTTLAKDFSKEANVAAFILWDDEDDNSINILAELKKFPCYDLTDGLKKISSAGVTKVVAPVIPKEEQVSESDEDEEGNDEGDEGDEEDDSEEGEEGYEEHMEDIYFGIQAIAKVFAQAIVEELGDALKTPQKGPTE